jgi:two-component system response regulator
MDEQLTLRALAKAKVLNPVVVVRDGAEALDYLFAQGRHADRAAAALPQVVLLDLKLPKVDGLAVLRAMRADERTNLLPVVILTSSNEDQDRISSYRLGANSYVRKPVDFVEFVEAARQLGLYWLVLNVTAPPTGSA